MIKRRPLGGLPVAGTPVRSTMNAKFSKTMEMSAATVLLVLEKTIRVGLPHRAVLTAMGPGFTASCASLTRVV